MTIYTLKDSLLAAYAHRYSENGNKLLSHFADWLLTDEDFKAARDVLPVDASWQTILEFAGRRRAIIMRIDCDFTQTVYENEFRIET